MEFLILRNYQNKSKRKSKIEMGIKNINKIGIKNEVTKDSIKIYGNPH